MCLLEDFQLEMDENAGSRTEDATGPIGSAHTWESPLCPPPWVMTRHMEQNPPLEPDPPPQLVEEFFCSSRTAPSLIPLVVSSPPHSDVVKRGYLGKMERSHRKFFVLRAGSHTGPSRLEWYKNQQNFTATEKSGGKAGLFGSKQGLVKTNTCFY